MNEVAAVTEDSLRSGFCNENGLTTFSVTADVDWAPNYAVERFLTIIDDAGVSASIYATHDQCSLKGLPNSIEVGLHPDNTRYHPEYGISRKLLDLRELFPDAVGVRCHRNFFGQNVAQLAVAAGMTYDASVFLWKHSHLRPWIDQFGLVRLAYNWEDGIQADYGYGWTMDHVPFHGQGLKIFNFHPIFVYLNCPDDDYRRKIVGNYKDLTQAPKSEIEPLIYNGYGAQNFLVDLLGELKNRRAQSVTLADIARSAVSTGRRESSR